MFDIGKIDNNMLCHAPVQVTFGYVKKFVKVLTTNPKQPIFWLHTVYSLKPT